MKNIVYMDNAEEITKKAFTRRCNALKKRGTLYRVAVIDSGDTVYNNIIIIE